MRLLSSVQITSSTIGFTSTLPAHTPLFTVGVALEKALLRQWLPPAEELPAVLAAPHPVVLDTLLTPALEQVLAQFAAPPATPYLAAFYYQIKTQELLYWLFRELVGRAAAPARPLHPADVAKIYQVQAALLASLSTPPRLADLAPAAGLSETKLKQLFRQVFGSSPYAYYQQARLAEARRLLQHGSVSEVGYQLGFTNLSHFARLFERQYGLPPKKYQGAQVR